MNTDRYNAFCYNTLRVGLDPPPFQQESDYIGGSTVQPKPRARHDENVLFALRTGLAEASNSPDLQQQLFQGQGELLPRFAEHYKRLKHLPRRLRRRLQRHWKRSLAGVALLMVLGQTPALAAIINVTGTCTLVRAIVAANNDTTATGHCKSGSGADRIVMPRKSTVTLTAVNATTYGATGLPIIRGVVTIDGNHSTIRRASSAPAFRVLTVGSTGALRLQETTVSGGLTAEGFPNNRGGGIYNRGTLALSNSTVTGNRAGSYGGGIHSFNGGINNGTSLVLTNSTVSGNYAGGSGGGINSYDNLNLNNSTVSGNQSSHYGGGVHGEGNLVVVNSTISGNTARDGGGVNIDYRGNASLINSTISGNTAGSGGGVYNTGSVFLTNSTVFGNHAAGYGGGVSNGGNNLGGDVTLTHTLVSGNTADGRGGNGGYGSEIYSRSGPVTAGSFNLFGHRGLTSDHAFVGFTPGTTDISATSDGNTPTSLARILNTTLANNGGRTRTHALVAGSPAVDVITDGTCPPPARDQRGVRRPQDGDKDGAAICDVGSFERE